MFYRILCGFLSIIFLFSSSVVLASDVDEKEDTPVVMEKVSEGKDTSDEIISLTPIQILNLAKEAIKNRQLDTAKVLLLKSPFSVIELEIERLYLIAQVYIIEGKIDDAIEIYRFILGYQPNIASIRLKLAELYMLKGSWFRADYHFRLALTDKNLPKSVQDSIAMALYVVRQNKNWNFWFNIGAAPDNNINNARAGEQCIMTPFGLLCNNLPDKEKAVGLNLSFGGNYEFKLSDRWRLRNELVVYNSTYDKKEYDDLYLSYVIGCKYVWSRGEVFTGLTSYRRWLHHTPYSRSLGVKVDTKYDFTKSLAGSVSLYYTPTYYDDYADILNGNITGFSSRFSYAFDVSKYIIFKFGLEKENTINKTYANLRRSFALGFGAELPYGFFVYLEPSILFTNYEGEGMVVNDYEFVMMREKDITKKYSVSFSNRKLNVFGFSPTLTYTYTDKDSNIWQKEYSKSTLEFTFNQSF